MTAWRGVVKADISLSAGELVDLEIDHRTGLVEIKASGQSIGTAEASHGQVFDGTPIEAFGGMDPELQAQHDRAIDRIEEAERG